MKSNRKPAKHSVAIMIAVGKPTKETSETKSSGVKVRGCGAATKGTTARGPMA